MVLREGDDAEMLSERASTAAAGVKGLITWKRFRASFQTRSGALSFVRAHVYDVAAVGIMRLTPRLYRRRDPMGPQPNGRRVFFKRSHWSRETWRPS